MLSTSSSDRREEMDFSHLRPDIVALRKTGLSYREIGEALGMSTASAHTHYHAATSDSEDESPGSSQDEGGSEVPWKQSSVEQIVEVTKDDGSIVYRCTICGYEHEKWNGCFGHLGKHRNTRKSGRKKKDDLLDRDPTDMTVLELFSTIEDLRTRLAQAEHSLEKANDKLDLFRVAFKELE
jgi:hypothetical protein